DLHHPGVLVAMGGTLLVGVLRARRYRGAILAGTLATGGAAVALGLVPYHGLLAAPPSLAPTFARLDLGAALAPRLLPAVFVLFFLGLFDTAGTLVGATLHPVVAPALIAVGSFLLRAVTRLELDDPPVAVASFLTVVTMPFTFSISEGIAFGFIAYAALMLAAGRGREVHPLLYVFAALFLARYALLG